MIHVYPKSWIIEVQNSEKRQGMFCDEAVEVKVEDEGGGPFICIKTVNADPNEIYDAGTITFNSKEQIQKLCDTLIEFWDQMPKE